MDSLEETFHSTGAEDDNENLRVQYTKLVELQWSNRVFNLFVCVVCNTAFGEVAFYSAMLGFLALSSATSLLKWSVREVEESWSRPWTGCEEILRLVTRLFVILLTML